MQGIRKLLILARTESTAYAEQLSQQAAIVDKARALLAKSNIQFDASDCKPKPVINTAELIDENAAMKLQIAVLKQEIETAEKKIKRMDFQLSQVDTKISKLKEKAEQTEKSLRARIAELEKEKGVLENIIMGRVSVFNFLFCFCFVCFYFWASAQAQPQRYSTK